MMPANSVGWRRACGVNFLRSGDLRGTPVGAKLFRRTAIRLARASWSRLKLLSAGSPITLCAAIGADHRLSLALTGATLAGIGEWAAGRFDNTEPEGGSSALWPLPAISLAAVLHRSGPMPDLPETSDHLPAARRDTPSAARFLKSVCNLPSPTSRAGW